MIIDDYVQLRKYVSVHPRFVAAFDALEKIDFENLQPGKCEVDGTNIFYMAVDENGVSIMESTAGFECHNKYIDIQLCLGGVEMVGWKSRNTCLEPRGEYDAEKDVLFYEDAPDMFFKLHTAQFGIYFPEDVHAPMIGEGKIKKIVMKVLY